MNKEVIVRITKNYGREAIYPINEAGEVFARLIGKKTFDRWDIEQIKLLGFTVNVQQEQL